MGWTEEHGVEQLLVHLRDSRPEVYRFVLVGFRAGLRIGEIIGRHVDDINLERGLIYARRTVSQTRQQVHAPKTAGSERKVYLAVSSLPWR